MPTGIVETNIRTFYTFKTKKKKICHSIFLPFESLLLCLSSSLRVLLLKDNWAWFIFHLVSEISTQLSFTKKNFSWHLRFFQNIIFKLKTVIRRIHQSVSNDSIFLKTGNLIISFDRLSIFHIRYIVEVDCGLGILEEKVTLV